MSDTDERLMIATYEALQTQAEEYEVRIEELEKQVAKLERRVQEHHLAIGVIVKG